MTHALSSAVMRFSPRARGCSQHRGVLHAFLQVFPACAGMFRWLTNGPMLSWGFPRVRGYVPCPACLRKQMSRFSPRARVCSVWLDESDGIHIGFPRVRGDVPVSGAMVSPLILFSPRARGCSFFLPLIENFNHVFPACAGMFPNRRLMLPLWWYFPRVRGDVPVLWLRRGRHQGFSPRARGCSVCDPLERRFDFVFPACAGMFPQCRLGPSFSARFPRVRGDVPDRERVRYRVG